MLLALTYEIVYIVKASRVPPRPYVISSSYNVWPFLIQIDNMFALVVFNDRVITGEKMQKPRLIRIFGTIDETSFKEFSEQLHELELEDDTPIQIELSSGGGVAYDALAFSGRMRSSPCHLMVTAYGLVASAAVLILASGDEKYMAKESWVMVHEDSGKAKGDVATLEKEIKHMRRMEDQWSLLLERLTGTDWKIWEELHKNTTYLCAAECLKLGLVDKLI